MVCSDPEPLFRGLTRDRFFLLFLAFTVLGAVVNYRYPYYIRRQALGPLMLYAYFFAVGKDIQGRRIILKMTTVALILVTLISVASWYSSSNRYIRYVQLPTRESDLAITQRHREIVAEAQIEEGGRATGMFYNPVLAAISMVLAAMFFTARFATTTKTSQRVLYGLLFLASMAAAYLTRSRGPLLFGLGTIFLGSIFLLPLLPTRNGKWLSLGLVLMLLPITVGKVLDVVTERGGIGSMGGHRLHLWDQVIRVLLPRSLVLGSGPKAVPTLTGYSHAHNIYLNLAVVYGIPLMVFLIVAFVLRFLAARRETKLYRMAVRDGTPVPASEMALFFLMAMMVGFLLLEGLVAAGFMANLRSMAPFWIVAGMGGAAICEHRAVRQWWAQSQQQARVVGSGREQLSLSS